MQENQNNLKKIIVVLFVLLFASVTALAGVKFYNRLKAEETHQTVTVPDNIIAPEKEEVDSERQEEEKHTSNPPVSIPGIAQQSPSVTTTVTDVVTISLYKRNSADNKQFNATNMFPGDVVTNNYCIRVSHNGDVKIYFDIDVKAGYEKLAEVMKCKVTLLSINKVIYEGLMKDMPDSVCQVTSDRETTTDLYYEIKAYLDTSVGNEYQNQKLVADFEWWVENRENLTTAPDTGDISNTYLWAGIMAASAIGLIILVFYRKKEEANG